MSTVSEILDRKGGMVLSVEIGETVFDAISLMAEVNIGAVLVQENGTIAGIFTERDYLTKVALKSLWIGDAGSGVAKGDAGSTMFTGEATIEMEALDSISSTQLAAHIETETGKKYNYTHGAKKGMKDYLDAYSKWDYTKQAMDDWALLLRRRLDAAHGITDK